MLVGGGREGEKRARTSVSYRLDSIDANKHDRV